MGVSDTGEPIVIYTTVEASRLDIKGVYGHLMFLQDGDKYGWKWSDIEGPEMMDKSTLILMALERVADEPAGDSVTRELCRYILSYFPEEDVALATLASL